MWRDRGQWQLEQLEDVQLLQLDEPTEVTVLLPEEKPKRETHLRTRLLLHSAHGGKGELEDGTRASKVW